MPSPDLDPVIPEVQDRAFVLDKALESVVESIGGERRDGQFQMAQTMADMLENKGHCLVQAGTGTGKSVAYLVPAALHAARNNTCVVIATATLALQRQLIERDLPRIASALEPHLGRELRFAVLKGRNNYVCLQKLHGSVAEDESDALFDTPRSELGKQAVAVRTWAEQTQTGDRDEFEGDLDPRVWRAFSVSGRECVGESRCVHGEDCFTVLRRAKAQEADIVVTNHAMLAIDAIEGIPVLPDHDAVIIDEAHELVDRATGAISADLSGGLVERAASRSRRLVGPEVIERLDDCADALDQALREAITNGPVRLVEDNRMITLALASVRDATHLAITVIQSEADSTQPDDLAVRQLARGALEEIHDTAGAILSAGSNDVVWIDEAAVMHIAPLSVAGLLRTALFDRGPVGLTSATLTIGGGFDVTLGSLGLTSDDATTIDVGSPFDYSQQGILYVAKHLPPPGRSGVAMEPLDELADLIEAAGGRTLALFSSWRGVEAASEYLRVRFGSRSDLPFIVQRKGDTVGPLVDRFAADPRTSLLGTLSLWQGVDVPGASCTLVVIDRIPFPRPDDPLVSARQQAIDDSGGSGFRSISVPRAGLLLAQGSGRLIRGTTDRGVVAVLDSRLATANYGRALRASMPPLWFTTDKDAVVGALKRLDQGLVSDPA